MKYKNKTSAEQILKWRNYQLSKGGNSIDLDWLLDIGGGLNSRELYLIKISNDISFIRIDCFLWIE